MNERKEQAILDQSQDVHALYIGGSERIKTLRSVSFC
jgi:hypothetical protein